MDGSVIELNRMIGLDRVRKSNQIEAKKLCESLIGFDF